MVLVVLSFELSKALIEPFKLLEPHLLNANGGLFSALINLGIQAGSFMEFLIVFIPMMLSFLALFWFLTNYLIKRFDLL